MAAQTVSGQAVVNHSTQPMVNELPEQVQKVRACLDRCIKFDVYNNCIFDFAAIPDFQGKEELKAVKVLLPILMQEQGDKHVLCIKMLKTQARIVKYASELGFAFHHANPDEIFMTKCLKDHDVTHCSYPKFMTVSVGVTGVVFDQQLEKVLLIQEKWGVPNEMKPPTGAVDYLETNEDPLSAVIREVREETGVDVDPKAAVLVGNAWTQRLRGNNPDVNYVFAFRIPSEVQLKAQEDEIAQVAWQPISHYLKETPEEESQPWVMKRVVASAVQALQNQKDWGYQNYVWNNGKPVTLYSYQPRSSL